MDEDPPAAYVLRAATASDHEFLRRAHHAGLRPWIEQTWDWDEAHQDEIHAERMGRRSAHMRVVLVGGQEAGYVDVDPAGRPWRLNSIVLLPAFQGGGLGTRIVRDIQASAGAAGIPLTLQVLLVNPARRLYERLGFERTGATGTHIQMRWEPDETMAG